MRLIDADALKESLKELEAESNSIRYTQGLQDAIDYYFPQIIDDAPTIDAEPVKHGELLAKIKDLIAKYKQAESGMIWETSGSIEEDEEKLEIECKELRKYFEKALGGAE